MIPWLTGALAAPVLAVADLRNQTGDARFDPAGPGTAAMIITRLAPVEQIELVERSELERVLSEIRLQQSGLVDDSSAVQAGRVLGADYLVLGSLFAVGDTLTVNLRVVNTETAGIAAVSEVRGPLDASGDGYFLLVEQLCDRVLEALQIELSEAERVAVDSVRLREVEALLRYGALAQPSASSAAAVWRDRANDLFDDPIRRRFVVYTREGALVPNARAFATLVGDTGTLERHALRPDGKPYKPRQDPLRQPIGAHYTPEEADRWIAEHNRLAPQPSR